jgi:hypothetical protein
MAKMFSKSKILMHDKDGKELLIPERTVFDATPDQAKQLDRLGQARPAREDEVVAANKAAALADGSAYETGAESKAPKAKEGA